MPTRRTCPKCRQSFNVPDGAPKLIACPGCGAAVPAAEPVAAPKPAAVTAPKPAAVTAQKPSPPRAPAANGRPAPPRAAQPPAEGRSSWIIFLVIGLVALVGLGVVAVIGAAAFFLFRSAPSPPVGAQGPTITGQMGTVENRENPAPPDHIDDNDNLPKPEKDPNLGPVPGEVAVKVAPNFRGRLGAAREKLLREGGGNAASQAAVDKGLEWLVAQQRKDGAWAGDGSDKNPVAGTATALLPLLGAGHGTKGAGTKHDSPVQKGLDFLIRQQRADGGLGANLLHHALATLALSEAFALTELPRYRQPAQKAVDFLTRNQHPGGGWRYQPRQPGDTFVTAWHVQALRVAQDGDLKVNKDVLNKAGGFLDSVSSERDSAYGLMTRTPAAMTSAAGLYSRVLLGWSPRRAPVVAGIERLKPATLAPQKGSWDSSFCYYTTYLLFQVGGEPWDAWNLKTRDFLISAQLPQGDWPRDNSELGVSGGKHACTSQALLALEVYYRYPRPKVLVGD